uniref:Glutamine amidotransferase domain-containing protein n=1 Tax=Setaria italica TaxID=4555 RepID=K3YUN2_SETIT
MTVATTKPAADGRGGRRYALLLALWDSEYAKKAYGGYYNVFVAAFGRAGGGAGDEGETWDCFRVIAGEFPAPEDLASYDGFVVSGSPHDAHGEEPWVRRLCALVQALHAMGKRVLGVCFGHQVLCRALGGTVGRARGGWDVGVKKVHQDEVWEVPPGATVLASSEKTRVEVFAVGEHALGIQGHPEYTTDTLHNLIDRLTAQGAIEARAGEDARRTVAETGGPDRAFWTGLCKVFLRGGGSSPRPAAPVRDTASEVMTSSVGAAARCFTSAAPIVQFARSTSVAGVARTW